MVITTDFGGSASRPSRNPPSRDNGITCSRSGEPAICASNACGVTVSVFGSGRSGGSRGSSPPARARRTSRPWIARPSGIATASPARTSSIRLNSAMATRAAAPSQRWASVASVSPGWATTTAYCPSRASTGRRALRARLRAAVDRPRTLLRRPLREHGHPSPSAASARAPRRRRARRHRGAAEHATTPPSRPRRVDGDDDRSPRLAGRRALPGVVPGLEGGGRAVVGAGTARRIRRPLVVDAEVVAAGGDLVQPELEHRERRASRRASK